MSIGNLMGTFSQLLFLFPDEPGLHQVDRELSSAVSKQVFKQAAFLLSHSFQSGSTKKTPAGIGTLLNQCQKKETKISLRCDQDLHEWSEWRPLLCGVRMSVWKGRQTCFFVCCYIPSEVSGKAAFLGVSRTASLFSYQFPSASLTQASRYFIGGGHAKQGLVFLCHVL